ncbi:MAG: hypothetical protein K2H96_00005 [Muribaculaceae bacterium]|nr:hypothetical protein [Muribaculaceae bacterium]
MNHKIRGITFLICLFATIAASGRSVNYSFEFDTSEVSLSPAVHPSGEEYLQINFPGLSNYGEENEPLLPMASMHFRVPVNAAGFKVSLTETKEAATLKLDKKILPVETYTCDENPTKNQNSVVFGPSYSIEPKDPMVSISNEFFLNGNEHYITVSVSPVLYNPVSNLAKLYSVITVTIDFNEKASAPEGFSPIFGSGKQSAYSFTDYVALDESDSKSISKAISKEQEIISRYLILVPENLKDAVSGIRDWKKQKGYDVTVQTIEGILALSQYKINENGKCFDKEASVREWMKDFYARNGGFYCLIVGDFRTSAPIRKFKSALSDLSDPNDSYYDPSDNYFADLVSDWSFTKDSSGIYSRNVDSSSFSPTVPVGRLLCVDSEDIGYFTRKLIIYELYPGLGDSSYLNRALLQRHNGSVVWNSQNLFENFKVSKVTTLTDNCADKFSDLRPFSKDVLAEMNQCGIYSMQNHGGSIGMRLATSKDNKSRYLISKKEYGVLFERYAHDATGLDEMTNFTKPAIMYSLACDVAPYDNKFYSELSTLNEKLYTIAGSFTVGGDYGGPAMLTDTREGSFPKTGKLEYEFGKYINLYNSIGEAENLSKLTDVPGYVRFRHNIIGDPDIMVWHCSPSQTDIKTVKNTNNFKLTASNLSRGFYGISWGSYHRRMEYINAEGNLEIPSSFLNFHKVTGIGTLQLAERDFLPETIILTNGSVITNCTERFTIREGLFHSPTENENYTPFLHIGNKGNIYISAFDNLSSNHGIKIEAGGELTLNSEKEVSLKQDYIGTAGKLSIQAKKVTLNNSTTIEKGGCLVITTKK